VDHPAEKHLTMKLTRAKFEAWSAQEMAYMKRQVLINARLRLERAYLKLRLFLQV
jgi:hypothetical protein